MNSRPNEHDAEEKNKKTSQLRASELDPLLSPRPGKNISDLETDRLESNILSVNNIIPPKENDGINLIVRDLVEMTKLALPIFVSMVSWVGMTTTDSSLLGHIGTEALSAAALSDLYTSCTGVLVRGRVLGILCSQAVGAGNPKLAGIYLQVAYVVLSFLSVFVIISWCFTGAVWRLLGEDDTITSNAAYYAKILAFSIPGQIAYTQLVAYFSSQRIMHPAVGASSLALCLNLILGLILVLGIPIPGFSGFGFSVCPVVTSFVVYVQFFFLWYIYCHTKGLHQACWGGWSANEITYERIQTFSNLYLPVAFGLASDFWRMGVIGTLAAKLGNEEVAVFNTSYRIMWIVIILTGSVAGAAGILMGIRLGAGDPVGARRAGYVSIFINIILSMGVSVGIWCNIRFFGRIFTNDETFLHMLEQCRTPFVAALFFMNLAVAIEKIPISMGRTREVFLLGLAGSWIGQVPGAFFLTKYWRNDLFGIYSGVALGYIFLVFLYSAITLSSDWKKYSDIAIQRSEMKRTR